MTTGIYILKFKGTDGVYIGQSIDIVSRISRHIYNMRNNKASKKLQEAYDTYGAPTGEILKECTLDSINEIEDLFIRIYRSNIHGFNSNSSYKDSPILYGEDNPNYSQNKSKTNSIAVDILKQLIQCSDKPDFSEISKNLSCSEKYVSNIYYSISSRWLANTNALEYKKLLELRNTVKLADKYPKEKIITAFQMYIDSPNTSIQEIADITGLLPSYVSSIGSGNTCRWLSTVESLRYSLIDKVVITRRNNTVNKYRSKVYPKLKSPEGTIHEVQIQSHFCKKFKLSPSGLSKLLSGTLAKHKGWTLE